MESNIAVITIIVENFESVERVNLLLHEYSEYIIGRFGLPVKDMSLSIISVVVNASQEKINALSGKLGMISGIKSKVLKAK